MCMLCESCWTHQTMVARRSIWVSVCIVAGCLSLWAAFMFSTAHVEGRTACACQSDHLVASCCSRCMHHMWSHVFRNTTITYPASTQVRARVHLCWRWSTPSKRPRCAWTHRMRPVGPQPSLVFALTDATAPTKRCRLHALASSNATCVSGARQHGHDLCMIRCCVASGV